MGLPCLEMMLSTNRMYSNDAAAALNDGSSTVPRVLAPFITLEIQLAEHVSRYEQNTACLHPAQRSDVEGKKRFHVSSMIKRLARNDIPPRKLEQVCFAFRRFSFCAV